MCYSKYLKLILSLVLVIALMFCFYSPAYADAGLIAGGIGAVGLAYALSAVMGVELGFSSLTQAQAQGWIDGMAAGITQISLQDITLTKGVSYAGATYDMLTIGVGALNSLRQLSNAIINKYNLDDNQSTTKTIDFADSVALLYTCVNSQGVTCYYSDIMTCAYPIGDVTINLGTGSCRVYPNPNNPEGSFKYKAGSNTGTTPFPKVMRVGTNGTNQNAVYLGLGPQTVTNSVFYSNMYTGTGFTMNSENIGIETGTLNPTYGNTSAGVQIYLPQNVGIQDVEDFLDALDDAAMNEDTIPVEEIADVPPTPVPTVYPDTNLGEVPYDEWMSDFGTSVTENQEALNEAIDTIGQSVETWHEENSEYLESIDTAGQSIDAELARQGTVLDAIGQRVQTIVDALTNVTTGIRTMVAELVDALEGIIDNAIEAIKEEVLGDIAQLETAFSGVISRLAQSVGIWHYVVEWIGSITTCFTWFFGVASGTSYYMVLPIYACIAGGIVLAVYKRFGR